VNTVRYARNLTAQRTVAAIIGGFHLSGPMFEPIIGPTADALAELSPSLLVPAHCTGWRSKQYTSSLPGSPKRSG
jgi:7,8-dihydropterin-6-yl-methyl-4-(beta-D-ribofuranosyl)aminobenzene 5'-phosphate synthase